jgi:hypothetical protein
LLSSDRNDNEAYYNKHLLRPLMRRRSYGSITSYLTDGGWGNTENDDRESFMEAAEAGEPVANRGSEEEGPLDSLPRGFGSKKGKRVKKRMYVYSNTCLKIVSTHILTDILLTTSLS